MIRIVEYLPQLSAVKQIGDLFLGTIRLIPGRNEVDSEKWKEYADHPLVKQRIQHGIIRVISDQPTVIAPPETKKSTRTSTSVVTQLAEEETTPAVVDVSTFVARPPEIEKTPTPPTPSKK